MNPTTNQTNADSLFEKSFEKQKEFEQPEAIDTSISYSKEHLKSFSNDWDELYSRTSEGPVTRAEVEKTTIETQFSQPLRIFEDEKVKIDLKPIFIINEQKGSSSSFVEYTKLLLPDLKDWGKSIFGALSLITELFTDTASLFMPKKEKPVEKPETDPEKAKAAAEKKAENQRKRNNMSVFIQAMQAQIAAIVSPDAARMETQEKANINLTAKIGQESYKGIKDAFGRLTIYAASMFERAQLDQEKQAKKQEKELKMAAVSGGPDLNLDKVAEGGFLSATGGQGAG